MRHGRLPLVAAGFAVLALAGCAGTAGRGAGGAPSAAASVPSVPSGPPPVLVTPPTQATGVPLRLGRFTIRVPRGWHALAGRHPGRGAYFVATGPCARPDPSACRGFLVLGVDQIKTGDNQTRPYTPKAPYNPTKDPQPCPGDPSLREKFPNAPKVNAFAPIGNHESIYREWTIGCVDADQKMKSLFFQRDWYLPTSKVLVVDEWSTPGLAEILRDATWP